MANLLSAPASSLLLFWIITNICEGSAHSIVVSSISCNVGQSAVLPCLLSVHQKSPLPYIQWISMTDTVLERLGKDIFQGEGYEGRADVPEQILQQGNCSLVLKDARLTDTGEYQSFLVVGQTRVKTKQLLQKVQFIVRDYKEKVIVESGKDLKLKLHTSQAQQLVFQQPGQGQDNWGILWKRGQEVKPMTKNRVWAEAETVVIEKVTLEDTGIYRILDEQGLALSTVIATVTEPFKATAAAAFQREFSLQDRSSASRYCCSLHCLLPALLSVLCYFT